MKRVVVLNSFEVLLKELRKRKLTNAKFQQKKVVFRSVSLFNFEKLSTYLNNIKEYFLVMFTLDGIELPSWF